MKRLILAAALVGASFATAPAQAMNCPLGTQPKPLPTGQNICVPVQHCDPAACVRCPYDVPVWSGVCREVFGG